MQKHKYFNLLRIVSLVGLVLILDSCSKILPEKVKIALEESGTNRKELEKVIEHYQSPEDSLKLKAAYFLIGNMQFTGFSLSEQVEKYDVIFDILAKKPEEWKKNQPWYSTAVIDIYDSLIQAIGPIDSRSFQPYKDITILDSKYLITNIDEAFVAWNKPWAKHLTFSQFCEYLLPYRITDEQPQYWREPYFNAYQHILESVEDTSNVLDVGLALFKQATPYFSSAFDYYPVPISPLNMLKSNYGNCFNNSCYKIYAMRAHGVPCVLDFIPIYGNDANVHFWNSTIDKYGNKVSFEEPFNDDNSMVAFKAKFKAAKIFRRTFAIQNANKNLIEETDGDVPALFLNRNYIDVSNEYMATTDVRLRIENIPEGLKYVYLCVFNNKGWEPVHFGKIIDSNYVEFNAMGRQVVYLPMYYKNKVLIAAGKPFLLCPRGFVKFFTTRKDTPGKVILTRKYKMEPRKVNWQKCLINGKFQGANNPDFIGASTLFTIQAEPSQHKSNVKINNTGKYRYLRFLFVEDSSLYNVEYDGTCIAETQYYTTNQQLLTGTPITLPGTKYSYFNPSNCFDNDPLSFYEDKRGICGKYVGLDLGPGRKESISEIAFQPRNDMNCIQPGDEYELFYWDDIAFKSLGKQIAKDTFLVYENAPVDALFWLRNHCGGNEERIFTYEEGKQIWW